MNLIQVAIAILLSAMACGCRGQEHTALESRVHGAGNAAIVRDTDSFVRKCLDASKRCMAVRFLPKSRSSFDMETTYVGGGMPEILMMSNIGVSDGKAWIEVECEANTLSVSYKREKSAEWTMARAAGSVERQQRGSRKYCSTKYDIPRDAVGLRLKSEYADLDGGAYVNLIDMRFAEVYSLEIAGAGTAKTFMQGSTFKEGMVNGEATPHFTVLTPMNASIRAESFIAISTYASVAEPVVEYEAASRKILLENNHKFGVARNSKDLISLYSGLSLTYKADLSNVGTVPVRGVDEIIESGFVDCKEAVLIGLAIAKENNIRAQAIVTSTKAPVPRFLFAPDFSWMNHVVLYFPDEGKYVDLTAKKGNQVISRESGLYGYMGVLAPSGDLVIIK